MLDKKEFEQIINTTIDCSYKKLKDQYVDGIQWSRPGILTGTGISIVDKENPNKSYTGVVLNLTEDITDTMKNLIDGESEKVLNTNNEATNDFLKDLNLNTLYNELVEEVLKNGYGYLFLHKDLEDNYSFTTMSRRNVLVEKNTSNKIERAFIVKKVKKSEFTYDYYITEYTNFYQKEYKNQELVSEVEGDFIIPVFEFGSGKEYLTGSILHYQDIINTKLTKAFDVEKYNTDPITVIKGINTNSSKNNSFDLGAGGVVALPSNDSSVEKLAGLGLTREFIDLLIEAKADFYRIAKLGALKSEDLSGVTSGYGLRLKLTDTLGFVENFRTTIKYNLYIMFSELFRYFKNPMFSVEEIEFAPLIGDKLLEDEAKQKKIDIVKTKTEIIERLTKSGFTPDQITQFLKDNEINEGS